MCSRLGPSLGCWLASVLPVVQAPRPGEAPPRALKPAGFLASRGEASGVRTRWGGVFLDYVAGPLGNASMRKRLCALLAADYACFGYDINACHDGRVLSKFFRPS